MTGWHAVVPIKPVAARKTRLRGRYSAAQVEALSDAMLRHVLDVLDRSAVVGRVTLLAARAPADWAGGWHPDTGDGLNAALAGVVRAFPQRVMIVHADLPVLGPDDIAALAAAARGGSAIAPDRHGRGTNALALADAAGAAFAFGAGSFARHRALHPGSRIVRRDGLAIDVDRPGDVALARTLGLLAQP